MCIIDCYCFQVSLCEAEVYVYEIPNLTIFESRLVILGLLSNRFDRTKVFAIFLMMSCCDMFDLTILESSISITLG